MLWRCSPVRNVPHRCEERGHVCSPPSNPEMGSCQFVRGTSSALSSVCPPARLSHYAKTVRFSPTCLWTVRILKIVCTLFCSKPQHLGLPLNGLTFQIGQLLYGCVDRPYVTPFCCKHMWKRFIGSERHLSVLSVPLVLLNSYFRLKCK